MGLGQRVIARRGGRLRLRVSPADEDQTETERGGGVKSKDGQAGEWREGRCMPCGGKNGLSGVVGQVLSDSVLHRRRQQLGKFGEDEEESEEDGDGSGRPADEGSEADREDAEYAEVQADADDGSHRPRRAQADTAAAENGLGAEERHEA